VAISDSGRALGITTDPDGVSFTGVYDPSTGAWSPLPVPDGAGWTDPVGLDDDGGIAVNANFRYHQGSYPRAYVMYPLTSVRTTTSVPQHQVLNAMNVVTGHAVGYDEALGGAFLYVDGGITPIAVQPGTDSLNDGASQALGINSRDQVVGWMRPSNQQYNEGQQHGFVYDHGTLIDLGGGTGDRGRCDLEAIGINDSGVVVGMIDVGDRCGVPQVFLWDGTRHIVGCPEGAEVCWPYAIGANGDVVGNALFSVTTMERAFIYHAGQFFLFDDLVDRKDWLFTDAFAINATGQVAANVMVGGVGHAAILTPRR
jgi:probable HAF family extracellular repeat protein